MSTYFLIAYNILLILTLPSLISKRFLRSSYLGVTASFSFLFYPLAYGAVLFLTWLTPFHLAKLLHALSIFLLLVWHLLVFQIIKATPRKQFTAFLRHLIWLLPALATYLMVLVLTRSLNSVLALDYLQHQVVVNKMFRAGQFCLLPNQCSNLFLQNGYTSFYHVLLGLIGNLPSNELVKTFYMIDFVWPVVVGLVLYKIFYKLFRSGCWASLAVLLSLLTFVNGAYEFAFFIPQTLAFFFFLHMWADFPWSPKKLVLGLLPLLLAHFVIGTFLAILLLLRQRQRSFRLLSPTALLGLDGVAFLFHYFGFSVETVLQPNALAIVGDVTNQGYPKSLEELWGIFGYATILVVFSLVTFLKTKHKTKELSWVLASITVGLGIYFLGPTYANKFLIGVGLFGIIFLVRWLIYLNMGRKLRGLVFILLGFIFALHFNSQFHRYASFYRQDSGDENAIVVEDQAILTYLSQYPQDCLIVSDPYTQLMVAAFTGHETLKAQYMEVATRRLLYQLATAPNERNYQNFMSADPLLQERKVCFLYTSRLEEVVEEYHPSWITYLYNFPIDNNYPIHKDTRIKPFLIGKGYNVNFANENFILFTP